MGTWQVTVPQQHYDITFWLLKIDPKAGKIDLLSSVNPNAKDVLSQFSADRKSVAFTLTSGPQRFRVVALAATRRGPVMKGALRSAAR